MNIKSSIFFSVVFLLFFFCISCESQKVSSELNPKVSKIQFSNSDFQNNSSEKQFIDQFNLNEHKYLNIDFDLEEPLIAALK